MVCDTYELGVSRMKKVFRAYKQGMSHEWTSQVIETVCVCVHVCVCVCVRVH